MGLPSPQATASPGLPATTLPTPVLQPLPCHESYPPWLPTSAPTTILDEYFFFNSLLVWLPYSSIFCQFWLFLFLNLLLSFFWLCEGAQCVYYSSIVARSLKQILIQTLFLYHLIVIDWMHIKWFLYCYCPLYGFLMKMKHLTWEFTNHSHLLDNDNLIISYDNEVRAFLVTYWSSPTINTKFSTFFLDISIIKDPSYTNTSKNTSLIIPLVELYV